MEYFSTFLTGFGNLVTKELKKQLPDIKIQVLLDGLISYKTEKPVKEISKTPFLNNSFLLLNYSRTKELEDVINSMKLPDILEQGGSFKIIYSKQNKNEEISSAVFDRLRQELGRKIHASYSPQSKQEFWIIERSEGFIFFGLRITQKFKPVLEKGQLQNELANLLCVLSEPELADVFLDPFAGSGAIAIARLKFPFTKILAGDMDGKISQNLQLKIQKEKKSISVGKWDALDLKNFADQSIDKIVTDPPWGLYRAQNLDLQQFYAKMLREFHRVLKPNGIAVILISNKELIEKILRESLKFELVEKNTTLVHGQKAGVYKLRKI